MIDLSKPIIGPAASVLPALRSLVKRHKAVAVLLDGMPGVGKSHVLDQFALEITGNICAVEHRVGQALTVEIVRDWREHGVYGNLFSAWTVKRIDEIDDARGGAIKELLGYLDYMPARLAVLASTNEYAKLRAEQRGRLETRFVRIHVDSPSVEQAITFLRKHYKLSLPVAKEIANGAVHEGCLPSEGVNMRAAVEDAKGYLAVRAAA